MHKLSLQQAISGLVLLISCSVAVAGAQFEFLGGDATATIGAYGTLGIVASDSDTLGFRRDIASSVAVYKGSPDARIDSQFNVHANIRYKNTLEATVQLKVREQANDDSIGDFLPLAFLTYKPTPSVSLRAGRLPIDVYMLSESRDVSYAYPWARQIVNFYGMWEMDGFEGVDASYRHQSKLGVSEWRISYGEHHTYLSPSETTVIRTYSKPYYAAVSQYDTGAWRARLSYMRTEVTNFNFIRGEQALVAGFANLLPQLPAYATKVLYGSSLNGAKTHQYAGGLAWDNGDWAIQTELANITFAGNDTMDYASGYLSFARRFDTWTPYIAWSRLYSAGRGRTNEVLSHLSEEDRNAIASMAAMVSQRINHSTLITGLRKDLSHNVALKLQWNYHRVGRHGAHLWHFGTDQAHDTRVNTFSLSMDFLL